MIVCVCNNISEREIHQAVELGVTSMSGLRDDLGVATCCGQCHECATQVLRDCMDGKSDPTRNGRNSTRPMVFRSAEIDA